MLGRIYCLLLRRHKWRRMNNVPNVIPMKKCARCGAVREVRQRKRRAT